MSSASCIVLPSYREGLPTVIAEAFSVGRPVIATSVGGVPEIVQDGVNGLLVGPGDVDGLKGALLAIASAPQARSVMGRRGWETVHSRFDAASAAERVMQIYDAVG